LKDFYMNDPRENWDLAPALTLLPTPLCDDELPHPVATELLMDFAKLYLEEGNKNRPVKILVEEHKVARRKWSQWAGPREMISELIAYNEHTRQELHPELTSFLKNGGKALLMSDGGLPAFYDPGQELVNFCHEQGLTVGATPYCHSSSLALALSGFAFSSYHFLGMPPARGPERTSFLKKALRGRGTWVLMDTPYRLGKLLGELEELTVGAKSGGSVVFLACNLGRENQRLLRGPLPKVRKWAADLGKAEFVIVLSTEGGQRGR
jgi:16S rRNA (cytidine1402-2'-O)-methyltransferase